MCIRDRITGERIFNNRTVSYEFWAVNRNYEARKVFELALKNWLMLPGILPIYDTHDFNYHWLGKCASVEVEDDTEYNRLKMCIRDRSNGWRQHLYG